MITREEYEKTVIRMWDSVRDGNANMGKLSCADVACNKCPIGHVCSINNYDYVCDAANVFYIIDAVEKWGEEHPIKTNRKVFEETMEEKFGDTIDLVRLQFILDEKGCDLLKGDCISDCKNCYQSDFWDAEYKKVNKVEEVENV